jgi:hypothetical protein
MQQEQQQQQQKQATMFCKWRVSERCWQAVYHINL